MKKIILTALAAAALTATAGAASAQPGYGSHNDSRYDQRSHYDRDGRYDQTRWNRDFVNRRQAELDRQIDVGIRRGTLTRAEATRMRSQFRDIARLEARYRHNGLSRSELAELDRRLDALETRIGNLNHNQYGQGYGPRR